MILIFDFYINIFLLIKSKVKGQVFGGTFFLLQTRISQFLLNLSFILDELFSSATLLEAVKM